MLYRANASMLAIQDPGGFVRYLMEEAGQDKSKLDVVVDVLCSLQVSGPTFHTCIQFRNTALSLYVLSYIFIFKMHLYYNYRNRTEVLSF